MKRTLLTSVLVALSLAMFGQQEPQFSQNMFTHLAINPGFAGMNEATICASMLMRQQWVGFQQTALGGETSYGGPQTTLFTLDSYFGKFHSGLGLTVYSDVLGFEDNKGLKISYAYKFNALNGKIGVGTSLGFLNKTIDYTKFDPHDPDPTLNGGVESDMTFDMAFGAFYKFPQDRGYVGLSSSQILEQTIDLPGSLAGPQLARHYYLTAGYTFPLPNNPTLEFTPSFLVKSDFGSTQFDINGLVTYNNRFWGGVSYRATDAVVILLGMYPFAVGNLQSLRIGYAYDVTTSAIGAGGRSSGSHEIFLSYCFNIVVTPETSSHSNVRYF